MAFEITFSEDGNLADINDELARVTGLVSPIELSEDSRDLMITILGNMRLAMHRRLADDDAIAPVEMGEIREQHACIGELAGVVGAISRELKVRNLLAESPVPNSPPEWL